MWHGAGSKPDAIRALKQVRKGDRVLCYHSAPDRSFYSIAEVTRDPYPDPHDRKEKNLVADLRAFEKLPRQVTLAEMRANSALRKVKFLKNVRLIISTISDVEYQEILRMAGIVPQPGIPLRRRKFIAFPSGFAFEVNHVPRVRSLSILACAVLFASPALRRRRKKMAHLRASLLAKHA